MGRTLKYYPSSGFLPSVVSAAFFCKTYNRLLTRNWQPLIIQVFSCHRHCYTTLTLNSPLCSYPGSSHLPPHLTTSDKKLSTIAHYPSPEFLPSVVSAVFFGETYCRTTLIINSRQCQTHNELTYCISWHICILLIT